MARNKKQGDKYNSPFAASLRQLLEDRNVTQGDIASLTGVTRQTVSQYCNGISEPGYDTLIKIANYFDVSVDYLLGRTCDPKRQASAIDDLGLSPNAVDKLIIYASRKDAGGFIDGINMILTLPRIFALAKEIDLLSRNIALEKSRLEQFERESIGTLNPLYSAASNMDMRDIDVSTKLASIIAQEYPEYIGRVSVSCGRAALQSQMRDIVDQFRNDVEIATGYIDCLLEPLNEI